MQTFKEYLAEVILAKEGSFATKKDFKPDTPDKIKKIVATKKSKMGEYEVEENHNKTFNEMKHIKLYHNGEHVGSIKGEMDGNKLKIEKSELSSKHQGKGLMPKVYSHLINHHGMEIHSDARQSIGGHSIWKKLHSDPTVSVVGHDENTSKDIPAEFGKTIDDHHYIARKNNKYKIDNF